MKRRLMFTLCAIALILSGCGRSAADGNDAASTPIPTGEPRRVIIDTDMAADDWMAILFLLQRPDIVVEAITVTGAGEAHCGPGTRHALELIALAGEREIPVACGSETPTQGEHVFPSGWRAAVDTLYGLTLPESAEEVSPESAVELLISIIRDAPGEITLLTLGPLTNVGEALQQAPALADDIAMIYVMGGAVEVGGNIHDRAIGNSVAEWNLYVDPHAAALTLASGAPLTFVPLDATNDAPVTRDFYEKLAARHTTPEATFVFDLLIQNRGFISSGGYYFWDPLAAAVVADESVVTLETRSLTIIETEGPTSGQTVVAGDGADVRVALAADRARFERLFLEALNRP
ncbi:MAG: nucleoside hydrolase [Anaerolineae bacterium]|nr:nucleoside hydrolase [Anaerolineae bacterium]